MLSEVHDRMVLTQHEKENVLLEKLLAIGSDLLVDLRGSVVVSEIVVVFALGDVQEV